MPISFTKDRMKGYEMEDESTHSYSVDDIMRIVRREAKKQTFGNSIFQKKKSYTYDDFLQYDFDDEIFIKNVYIGLLEREADPIELNMHLDLLQSGEKTKVEIITLLRENGEGQVANVDLASVPFEIKENYTYDDFLKYDSEEFIRNVYLGLLLREADPEGLKYYIRFLESGEKTKIEIITMFRNSGEGHVANINLAPPPFEMKDSYTYDDFLQYDDVEFIKNAYLGLLKREVGINGLNNHLSLLHSGKISKRDIIDALLTSEEGLTAKVMVQ